MKILSPNHLSRRFRLQLMPNLIRPERRLVLTRIYWNTGAWRPNGSTFCSHKLSISVCWKWQDLWVGLFIKPELWGFILYLCLIPCLPIRIHFKRSYGCSLI